MARRKNPHREILKKLDQWIAGHQEEVLELTEKKTVQSLHGVIGGKNDEYADVVHNSFGSPEEFITAWKAGALKKAKQRDKSDIRTYGQAYKGTAAHRIVAMLKQNRVKRYIEVFLTRNFYREYIPRVREKPEDQLWEVWFGANNQDYGIMISPRWTAMGEWENDVSEIRRASFRYWTVGHVMATGLVVAGDDDELQFGSLKGFLSTYTKTFVRPNQSKHGTALAREYVNFVLSCSEPLEVPFLIPEFRFAGLETKHKYRLDFTVLSADHDLKIGIELSPWSSHGRIKGKRALRAKGGEAALEEVRKHKFEKEMKKRNEYFAKYGITTLTFTDEDLANVPKAFKSLRKYLRPKEVDYLSASQVDADITDYDV